MKRKTLLFSLLAAALLLLSGFAAQREIAARRAGEWVPVRRDDLLLGAEITGQLESIETSLLGPPQIEDFWDFKIAMLIPEGTDVKAGTPVLAFDTDALQRELEEKSAEADSARKEIEKKRADLDLNREEEELRLAEADARLRKADMKLQAPADLVGRSERKEIEIDRKTSSRESSHRRTKLTDLSSSAAEEIRLLETKMNNAARRVAAIQASIARMTVVAPRDGTVVYVTNWRGEKKKVGDSCWMGEKIVEIPNLNRMQARGEIDESDSGRVTMGQRVTVRLDALPDEEIHGRVTSIGRTVQRQRMSSNPIKVLNVKIALDRVDPAKMRPGMRFQGILETSRVRDAVVVPADALSYEAGKVVVSRRTLLSFRKVAVETGRRNNDVVEIVRGLAPGDRVLLQQGEESKS
jgi:HlyD family secretion protein